MESETRFILTKSIKYGHTKTGDLRDAQFIELREPTGVLVMDAAPIRQSLVRAFTENEERAERLERERIREIRSEVANNPSVTVPPPEEDEEPDSGIIDPVTILAIIAMSSVDMQTLYGNVREILFKPGVAYVDGEIPFTSALFDLLSLGDAQKLIGTYCGAFFKAS